MNKVNGQFVFQEVDAIPPSTRPGSGNHQREDTDADIALRELASRGPGKAVKLVDYNVEIDEDGNVVNQAVDSKLAQGRAGSRIQALTKRGYTKDAGYQFAQRGGVVYVQYWGPGNVPVKGKDTEDQLVNA